uniref:Cytochrome c oxidase subunit 3 n=1 Tax=Dolichovespula kuami TaxID=2901320 RepID=A0A9E6XS85_9HYME|nr:cytochrome c oxidase subunit III [Dolichovespula kuami]UGB89875.1 cytochrome c oxidase subunit III [Dolichovespula kuami]
MQKSNHPYHEVTHSPWPLMLSINSLIFMMSFVKWLHFTNLDLIILSTLNIFLILMQWWRDIIRESTFQGMHSFSTQKNLKSGMILFIISEIFFFISMFWAYFHVSLSPSIEIGMLWPPKNIIMFDPYNIPLLNSIILISSGMTITLSHHYLMNNKLSLSIQMLYLTLLLSTMFSIIQIYEYNQAPFTIADSIFGSIFFLTTGFHGIHVLIGSLFLMICLIRLIKKHFSMNRHFGYEAAIWYWHFVDIVWLFVFMWLYWWSF